MRILTLLFVFLLRSEVMADCSIPEDLKLETIQFNEEIVGTFNFRENTADFETFVHLDEKIRSEKNSNDGGQVWYQIKSIPQDEVYVVIGCKKNINFEGTYYLLLKGITHNSEFLIHNRIFDQIKKKINNDYFKLYDAIKANNYSVLQELLKKIDWKTVAPKALDILAESGDEKTFDILVAHSGEFPAELFMLKISHYSSYKFLPKVLPLIPKAKRAVWLDQLFYLTPVNQLSIFNEVKKEDIDKSRYTALINFACLANDYNEKLAFLAALGFNFKEKDEDESNAIHRIAQFGNSNFPCIDFLLSKGININDIDKNGDTPLHRANSVLNKKLSLYLISKGALTTIKNNRGKLSDKY